MLKKSIYYLFVYIQFLFIFSCSSIFQGPIEVDETQISASAREVIEQARNLIRNNRLQPAIVKLNELNNSNLSPLEKSLMSNLKGVIYFQLNDFRKSYEMFEFAEKNAPPRSKLYAQIKLNLASNLYRQNRLTEVMSRLDEINPTYLTQAEIKKYAQLKLYYAEKYENNKLKADALIYLLSEARSYLEIEKSSLISDLNKAYLDISPSDRLGFLEKFEKLPYPIVAYLAQKEADYRYFNGDKDSSRDIVSWLDRNYSKFPEVQNYLVEFRDMLDVSARMEPKSLGVILPLSGSRSAFGLRALGALEAGLKSLNMGSDYTLFTKDNSDSPAVSREVVADLIKQNKISVIIGGLFPETAKDEYLVAKRYGVLFISLSPINLPRDQKNFHLIEIQGSIESQVASLLDSNILELYGKKMGLIYPDNDLGEAYLNEFWHSTKNKDVRITALSRYPKNNFDYRGPVSEFLGLKFTRERKEENDFLQSVYALERSSVRRVQTLPPVTDFDWIFLASLPHEAVQIIPTLSYFDANKLKIIGTPSWITKSFIKEYKQTGKVLVVGNDPKDIDSEILNNFKTISNKTPGVVEMLNLEALKIAKDLLSLKKENRIDFDKYLLNIMQLSGLGSVWNYKEGLWVKKMDLMTNVGGEFNKLNSLK